jgi:hypothetical protein
MNRDWTLLPSELLQLISENLISISDFVHFRAVCAAWRSASSPRSRHLPPQLPWLILPRGPDRENADLGSILSVYDLSMSKTHTLDLPQINGKRICGSSHGWLVLEKEKEVWLFNPITRLQISLPSLSAQPNSFIGTHSRGNSKDEVLRCGLRFCIRKAILSSSPIEDPDCLVMALFQGSWTTAFCRINDACWTTLNLADELPPPRREIDIGYYNGLFYSILGNGHARIYDIRNARWKYLASNLGMHPEQKWDYICTVEGGCNGHGLMVFAQLIAYFYQYDPVDASALLMLSESIEPEKWVQLKEEVMGSNCFFIGGNFHCISLPVSYLQLNGWEGNCICFSTPQLEEENDGVDWYSCCIKLFKCNDRSITTLASHIGLFEVDECQCYSISPSFLWLAPTLN